MSLQTTCPIRYLLSKSEMHHIFLNFSGILIRFMNSQTEHFLNLSSSYKHFWEYLFPLKLYKFPLIVRPSSRIFLWLNGFQWRSLQINQGEPISSLILFIISNFFYSARKAYGSEDINACEEDPEQGAIAQLHLNKMPMQIYT